MMTVLTLPLARGWQSRSAVRLKALASSLIRPVRPVLANAAQIPLTLAAYGCLATAAFLWNDLAGLVSTGVLLLVLEHQLADDE